MIAIFNPHNYPNVNIHFDHRLENLYKMYRSIHILAARDTEAPVDLFIIGDGGNSLFKEIPPIGTPDYHQFQTNLDDYVKRKI